jgi:hypothetical protein
MVQQVQPDQQDLPVQLELLVPPAQLQAQQVQLDLLVHKVFKDLLDQLDLRALRLKLQGLKDLPDLQVQLVLKENLQLVQ